MSGEEIQSVVNIEGAKTRSRPSNDELVDDLLERAGGVSTFHVMVYFAISAGVNNMRAFLNYMIPFLIQKQVYKCTLIEG